MPCDPEKITYHMDRLPDETQVIGLYRETGWITEGMSVSFVPAMLKNSFAIATAYEGDRLIGMMRALSDGVSDAYLLDLVVAEDCRKMGIGKKVLDLLCSHLKELGIDWIVWIGAPGTEKFYTACNAAIMEDYIPYRLN